MLSKITSASSSVFPGNLILMSSKACSVRRHNSSSLSRTAASKKAASTTGLNFIGGDEDDVTILCVEERVNIRPLLAEFGAFWAETGLKDDEWDGVEV